MLHTEFSIAALAISSIPMAFAVAAARKLTGFPRLPLSNEDLEGEALLLDILRTDPSEWWLDKPYYVHKTTGVAIHRSPYGDAWVKNRSKGSGSKWLPVTARVKAHVRRLLKAQEREAARSLRSALWREVAQQVIDATKEGPPALAPSPASGKERITSVPRGHYLPLLKGGTSAGPSSRGSMRGLARTFAWPRS